MEELVQKAKNGNNEAFTQLFVELENNMYKIAKIRLHDESNIEDAVQETILEVFKSIKKLKNNEYFKTWVTRILINKCNKIYKKHKFEKFIENEEIEQECDTYSSNSINDVDNKLDFYLLLKGLNCDEKTAIVLYYMGDFTTNEISIILNESASTIKNRIARARKKIEERIGEKHDGTV